MRRRKAETMGSGQAQHQRGLLCTPVSILISRAPGSVGHQEVPPEVSEVPTCWFYTFIFNCQVLPLRQIEIWEPLKNFFPLGSNDQILKN